MSVCIREIRYHLPERVVTNEQLRAENPSWDMDAIEARSGVRRRHVAAEGETALDLAVAASRSLLDDGSLDPNAVDGIVFCTQTPDYVMPPNACLLHEALALGEGVFAFDFTLACSGYVYGLSLVRGLIQTGQCRNVLLVNADTYSKRIHAGDRSARVLFGDGAAVSWVSACPAGEGIIDVACATAGKEYEKFMVPAGGCRLPASTDTKEVSTDRSGNTRTPEDIHMDGMGILVFVNSKVPRQIRDLLVRNSLSIEDVDLFVFHQASRVALDSLTRLLKLPTDKVFENLEDVGNTVSASIPVALKDALDQGAVSPGGLVLLCGFGVGLSWGTALVRLPG